MTIAFARCDSMARMRSRSVKGHGEIGAVAGLAALWNDPQSAQAEGVVDTDAARVRQACADGADEGVEAGAAQRERAERGDAPILPLRPERIGRRADRQAGQQVAAAAPRMAAARIHADGEIGDQADPHAGVARGGVRVGKAGVGAPLQEGVKADGVGMLAREGLDSGAAGS